MLRNRSNNAFLPGVASPAALIADPVRAAMLTAVMDGRALTACELARVAGVTPQTASSHLAKLVAGSLMTVEREGRHRYYRLASAEVAEALEILGTLGPPAAPRRPLAAPAAQALSFARSCYDHLAGELGVAVTAALEARGLIRPRPDRRYQVTARGRNWFAELDIDVTALRPGRKGIARQCLDWTERRHHLAGSLGAALLASFETRRWVRRAADSRAIRLTGAGRVALHRRLGVEATQATVRST